MKPLHYIFSLLLIVVLVGAGCGRSAADQARDAGTAGETSRVPEVEAALGIDLPSDAEIFVVIDNPQSYSTTVLTQLSVHDAKGYFAQELNSIGLSPKRAFGTLPTDSDTRATAVYSGNGENWAVNIFTRSGKTEVNLQREY